MKPSMKSLILVNIPSWYYSAPHQQY